LRGAQTLEEDEIDEDEEPQEEGNNLSMDDLSEYVCLTHSPKPLSTRPKLLDCFRFLPLCLTHHLPVYKTLQTQYSTYEEYTPHPRPYGHTQHTKEFQNPTQAQDTAREIRICRNG
jgi:hypothetical protein